jgi:hypothetical protein
MSSVSCGMATSFQISVSIRGVGDVPAMLACHAAASSSQRLAACAQELAIYPYVAAALLMAFRVI